MFIPRQVQKHSPKKIVVLKTKSSHAPPQEKQTSKAAEGIDPELAKELVLALEILLSSYELSKGRWAGWLKDRMRCVEGREDFVHLSALVECPFLNQSTGKKELSQLELIKAMEKHPSETLELSQDRYHIRRRAELDEKLANVEDWEGYTVYVEPHITKITTQPGKLARFLTESPLPRELFPIQAVDATEKEYGLVTFSSEISQADIGGKLRDLWPENWIVLSKAEWKCRDTLYQKIRLQRSTIRQSSQPPIEYDDHHDDCQTTQYAPTRLQTHNETASYKPGLIVHLMNLHSSTTKTTIVSFISRSVDRYKRKRASISSISPPNRDSKDPETSPGSGDKSWCLKVNYMEYEKGSTRAYARLENPEDAELVVKALKRRKRIMKNGEDTRGRKAGKTDEGIWIKGEVLTGQEEEAYWEKVARAKEGKGKKKNTLDVRPDGMKRVRERSQSTITNHGGGKKIKFEE